MNKSVEIGKTPWLSGQKDRGMSRQGGPVICVVWNGPKGDPNLNKIS